MSQPTTEQLVVSDLHKRYGDNEVLKGVSLSAHAGDVISIIGSSGSGKSTFLRCINLLERPHIGSITLNGETLNLAAAKDGMLNATDKKQLQLFRAKLAMVFQHFNLWAHLNVLDNITEAPIHVLGLSKAQARERARHYLNKVGLSGAEDKYPAHMSGGQQQRVAIARALAMEVVTHEMGFAKEVSNKVMFLHQGVVEEAGDPKVVLNHPTSERLQQFLAGSLK
jgi:arginine/ornithine transport system ATP-binding protein